MTEVLWTADTIEAQTVRSFAAQLQLWRLIAEAAKVADAQARLEAALRYGR